MPRFLLLSALESAGVLHSNGVALLGTSLAIACFDQLLSDTHDCLKLMWERSVCCVLERSEELHDRAMTAFDSPVSCPEP